MANTGEPAAVPGCPAQPDGICGRVAAAGAVDGAASGGEAGGGMAQAQGAHVKGLKAIHINLAACKYSVLRVVASKLGWVEVGDDSSWQVCWTDTSSGTDRLMRLRQPQKLNHFPGMLEIARKKSMARNLANMRTVFPQHYDFNPRTFLLPEMMEAFLAEFGRGRRGGKTFIMKLDNGSQGRGIKLVQSATAALAAIPTFEHENIVASQYIANPFLVNGYKFDLRIYVLVRCCDPLRVFIHNEGLARFCTEKYDAPSPINLGNNYAHLTNYAVNKHNPNFVFNKDAQRASDGSKWSISALAEWMRQHGHDWEGVWGSIKHMIAKSLIAIQPILQYHYRSATKPDDDGFSCFEVLGYDVLLDEGLRPWLVEVNHSPSFTTDTPLDLAIKERLITEAVQLVGINVGRFREDMAAKETAKMQRLYSAHQHHHMASCAASPHQPFSPSGPTSLGQEHRTGVAASPPHERQQQPPPRQQQQPQQQQGEPEGAGHEANLPPLAPPALCADWEARQRAHEDANMGHYERILPADDPEKQALYEELQHGAQQVFYKQTMQGRLQHALIQIKEKRQAEEAEAAAKQEAHRRRVESLKAWMATVYVKTREQRQRAAAEEQALQAAAHTAAGLRLRVLPQGGGHGVAGGAYGCGDTDPCAGASPAVAVAEAGTQYEASSTPISQHRPETACTAFSDEMHSQWGTQQEDSGGISWGGCCTSRCSSPAAGGIAEALSIQGVRPGTQLAACGGRPSSGRDCPASLAVQVAARAPAAASPPRYEWRNKPAAHGQGGGTGAAPPDTKPAPYGPSVGSGRFMRRIAALHQGRGPTSSARCRGGGRLPDDSCSNEGVCCGSLQGCGDSASEWQGTAREPGHDRESLPTYIPPAMLSALHSVNLGAQLLGPRPPPLHLAGTPGVRPSERASFGSCFGRTCSASRVTGSPAPSSSPSRNSSLTPVAAHRQGCGQHPSPERRGMQPCSPAHHQQQRPDARQGQSYRADPGGAALQGRDSAGSTGRRDSLAGSTASLQAAYIREIEKQTVKSIAEMIADVLGK